MYHSPVNKNQWALTLLKKFNKSKKRDLNILRATTGLSRLLEDRTRPLPIKIAIGGIIGSAVTIKTEANPEDSLQLLAIKRPQILA